jgi:hypothetical protein
MYDNLIKTLLLEDGSTIQPLYIKSSSTNIGGLCNASLCYHNNTLHIILRSVEYTLHCCEGEEKYQSTYEGPVSYYHKDSDLTLKTVNYYGTLNPDTLILESYNRVNTSNYDTKPLWCFIGLEDARIVNWNNTARSIKQFSYDDPTPHVWFAEYIELAENQLWVLNNESIEVNPVPPEATGRALANVTICEVLTVIAVVPTVLTVNAVEASVSMLPPIFKTLPEPT